MYINMYLPVVHKRKTTTGNTIRIFQLISFFFALLREAAALHSSRIDFGTKHNLTVERVEIRNIYDRLSN